MIIPRSPHDFGLREVIMKIRDLLIKLRIKQIDDKIILLIFAIKDKKYNF